VALKVRAAAIIADGPPPLTSDEERYARYVVSDLLDDLAFANRYCQTFETLFTTGQSRDVIQLAEDILRPAGGRLFDGYRAEAPTHWKKPTPSA
jgi:hypothetical protein